MSAVRSPLHETFSGADGSFEIKDDYEVCTETFGKDVEYCAVRNTVGVSDRSDSAVFRVSGEDAQTLLDRCFTASLGDLPDHRIRQTLLLSASGETVTDALVCNGFDHYLIFCPRTARSAVLQALEEQKTASAAIEDLTDKQAIISVEGPAVPRTVEAVFRSQVLGLPVLHFLECSFGSQEILVARYGTTGEYGYWVCSPPSCTEDLLEQLLSRSEPKLCGRSVQDLLGLEFRAFLRHRHMPRGENALEAGLHWMCGFRKSSFAGSNALFAVKERGIEKKLIALRCEMGPSYNDLGDVFLDGDPMGYTVHSDFSPVLERQIALAYIRADVACPGAFLRDAKQWRFCRRPLLFHTLLHYEEYAGIACKCSNRFRDYEGKKDDKLIQSSAWRTEASFALCGGRASFFPLLADLVSTALLS